MLSPVPSGPRLTHREADQGIEVFSGVQSGAKAQICTEAKAPKSHPFTSGPFWSKTSETKRRGGFRGGGIPTRRHETPGRALLRSPRVPSVPFLALPGIQGVTRAGGRAHTVKAAQAHFSDLAGVGGDPGSRAICLRRETTTAAATAGASSSKMPVLQVTRWGMTGNSFSLLRQQKQRAARVPV